jgi:P protein
LGEIRENEGKEKDKTHAIAHQESPPKFDDFDHAKENQDQNPFHKFGKTGFLVVVWVLMVFFLTSTPEKTLDRRQLAVPIFEPRIFTFPKLPSGARINPTLSGAFSINETKIENPKRSGDFINKKVNETVKENYIRVYLQTHEGRILTHPKVFSVTPPGKFDTTNPVKIPVMFDIGDDNLWDLKENNLSLQLYVESNFTKTVNSSKQEMPLIFTYDIAPINRQLGVIFAAFVLIFLYALIIYEVKTVAD